MDALGAIPRGDGAVDVRVWAPRVATLAVRLGGETLPLAPERDGVFAATIRAEAGEDYELVLDGERALPDPCSRSQPHGIDGPSRIFDPARLTWTDEAWSGLSLADLVLYELHVGTFTAEGTFDAAIPHLAGLRELGVTAVELMPVAEFPGERGWGYDGVYAYAAHHAYGGADGLARLVDAAHAVGLGVILDVVYNHLGPGADRIDAFGPYHTDRYETFWGSAMNYDGDGSAGVREWAIQNACYWVRGLHVDGLRLDATHAVFDSGPRHVLAELADRARRENPRALITSEMETGDLRPIRDWGHDAQWADELHHELHVLLTGEQEGYYADYGSVAGLAHQLEREPAERLIVCSQNHDQVGNRAIGDRPSADELRIRAAVTLFAPQTPLLFMGEEYGERAPFQFFTDHIDPAFAEATREGRRREFADFAAFSGEEVPDPQARETFERSKLTRRRDPELERFYADLLRLRRELPREITTEVDEDGRVLRARRGDTELVADFAGRTAEVRRWR